MKVTEIKTQDLTRIQNLKYARKLEIFAVWSFGAIMGLMAGQYLLPAAGIYNKIMDSANPSRGAPLRPIWWHECTNDKMTGCVRLNDIVQPM